MAANEEIIKKMLTRQIFYLKPAIIPIYESRMYIWKVY